jgi:2-succinyl-6-hydroxy-2,4-cyclohexadiene-1-carboxylate synthase
VPLHVEIRGDGPPLVLLHGFTQTSRLWGPLADRLADVRTLVGVDLPGHAGSDAVRANLSDTAALVAQAVTAAVGDNACELLGYSLGARVALHVLDAGELRVARTVLIGAAGGMEDEARRQARRQSDEALADALEASGDVEAFIDRWLSGPMFERLDQAAGRQERLRNSAAGLASSLRLAGAGTQAPLWERLATIETPLLALAGTDDDRFSAHALRLAATAPHAVASLIPGGGHAAHLAQPDAVTAVVRHWLTAT